MLSDLSSALSLLPDNLMPAESLIAYCRPGFEGECAQEIVVKARARSLAGEVRADSLSGFVEYRFEQDGPVPEVGADNLVNVRSLIFSRQSLLAFAHLERVPRADRLAPIMAALTARDERYYDGWAEAPDTDEGKALAPFCKSFGNALISGLKRAHLLDPAAPRRLHAFFPQSNNVYLAVGDPAVSSAWPQGIPRLKFPREAPSRSTLKLDEAFLLLLDEGERTRWLKPGMSAVDLGAAPGGWTWQFVQRSMRVTAVDNGPMSRALLDSGLVTHACEDGFRFRPKKPVDWLVCDMVEQPRRVAELIARWFAQGWCRRAIFNLKLPMKKRYEETQRCLDIVRAAAGDVRAKHLYHDREEITAFAQIR